MSTQKKVWIALAIVLGVALVGIGSYFLGQKLTEDAERQKAAVEQQAAVNKAIVDTKAELNKNNTGSNTTRPPHETTPPKTSTDPTCNADELSLSTGEAEGGASAGTFHYNIILTNIGKRTCTLFGYPGVSLVNDNGNQIGNPADRQTGVEEKTQTLTPGAKVKSVVSVPDPGNFPDGQCKDGATKFRVYPPNDAGYLSVATTTTTWCQGLAVTPVQPL